MFPLTPTVQSLRYIKTGVVACAALLVVAAGCSRNAAPVATAENPGTEAPVTASPSPTKAVAKPTHIVWEPSFEAALAKAKSSGKPVMIDFYAVWCGPCKMLDKETYTAQEVIEESGNFVNVKVDVEKRPDLERRYQLTGYPTIIVADATGKAIEIMPGFAPADQFVEFMRSGRSKLMVAVVT